MKSIYFDLNIPKFLLTKTLSTLWNGVYYSSISPVSYSELEEIPLPGTQWVRVRNRLSGICGSDLTLFFLKANPNISAAALPGMSRIFLGHEICGEVIEAGKDVADLRPGQRVVFQKIMPSCYDKEIEPKCCHCQAGNYTLCENQSESNDVGDVGGGWSEMLVAHESQLLPIPDEISDEEAVLIEPAAVCMHAIMLRPPKPNDNILVVGAGIIGLLTLHILKQLEPSCNVSIAARYSFQKDQAKKLGADHIVDSEDMYSEVAEVTNGKLFKGMFNNKMILGGFDKIFDCVGNGSSIHDALRWCKAGGSVILVGIDLNPSKFDYTPLALQETELVGSFCHGMETYDGEKISSFELVIKFLKEKKIDFNGLITHRFTLSDYKKALTEISKKGESGAIKAVFEH
jgi:threonine dehydrogenase-like Zn-dependent dehydrogenase